MAVRRRGVAGLALLLLAAAMVAPVVEGGKPSQVHVVRRPPQAQDPDASASDDDSGTVGVQVNPVAGSSRAVTAQVRVDDDNGHNDVSTVTVTIFQPDNSTVHREGSTATKEQGNGRRAAYSYTFFMDHHDDPGTYLIRAVVADRDGETHTTWSSFTFRSLAAVSLDVTSFSLGPGGSSGAIDPGNDTRDSPAAVAVSNSGNTVIDLQFSGTDMTNATLNASIPADRVRISTTSDMSGEVALNATAQTDTSFDLAPGQNASKPVYFATYLPLGTRAATYAGTITLAAVADA